MRNIQEVFDKKELVLVKLDEMEPGQRQSIQIPENVDVNFNQVYFQKGIISSVEIARYNNDRDNVPYFSIRFAIGYIDAAWGHINGPVVIEKNRYHIPPNSLYGITIREPRSYDEHDKRLVE